MVAFNPLQCLIMIIFVKSRFVKHITVNAGFHHGHIDRVIHALSFYNILCPDTQKIYFSHNSLYIWFWTGATLVVQETICSFRVRYKLQATQIKLTYFLEKR